jgi:hypothetical protein
MNREMALATGRFKVEKRIETIMRCYLCPCPKRRPTKPLLHDGQREVLEADQPPVQLPTTSEDSSGIA